MKENTLRTFYHQVGGDYEEVLSRLGTEELVIRFLGKFLQTPEYAMLIESIAMEDWSQAFRMAHTLKGMCANLGLGGLQTASAKLCDLLRQGAPVVDVTPYLQAVEREYTSTIQGITQLE